MKKVLTSLIVVVMLIAVVCGCVACSTKDPFDQVVDCAKALRTEINDESFEISGRCGYEKYYTDDEGTTHLYIFVAIPFQVKGESGEYVKDVAFYVGDSLIGYMSDFDEENYEQWTSQTRLEKFLYSIEVWIEGYTEVFDKEKVNSALGIGVSSGEVGSGTVSGEGTDAE
ncbi:MAG: hypothetical protein K2O86_00015 [Clostridia bacterium]|nr:hypothetical protein [Clostridia bacterium]